MSSFRKEEHTDVVVTCITADGESRTQIYRVDVTRTQEPGQQDEERDFRLTTPSDSVRTYTTPGLKAPTQDSALPPSHPLVVVDTGFSYPAASSFLKDLNRDLGKVDHTLTQQPVVTPFSFTETLSDSSLETQTQLQRLIARVRIFFQTVLREERNFSEKALVKLGLKLSGEDAEEKLTVALSTMTAAQKEMAIHNGLETLCGEIPVCQAYNQFSGRFMSSALMAYLGTEVVLPQAGQYGFERMSDGSIEFVAQGLLDHLVSMTHGPVEIHVKFEERYRVYPDGSDSDPKRVRIADYPHSVTVTDLSLASSPSTRAEATQGAVSGRTSITGSDILGFLLDPEKAEEIFKTLETKIPEATYTLKTAEALIMSTASETFHDPVSLHRRIKNITLIIGEILGAHPSLSQSDQIFSMVMCLTSLIEQLRAKFAAGYLNLDPEAAARFDEKMITPLILETQVKLVLRALDLSDRNQSVMTGLKSMGSKSLEQLMALIDLVNQHKMDAYGALRDESSEVSTHPIQARVHLMLFNKLFFQTPLALSSEVLTTYVTDIAPRLYTQMTQGLIEESATDPVLDANFSKSLEALARTTHKNLAGFKALCERAQELKLSAEHAGDPLKEYLIHVVLLNAMRTSPIKPKASFFGKSDHEKLCTLYAETAGTSDFAWMSSIETHQEQLSHVRSSRTASTEGTLDSPLLQSESSTSRTSLVFLTDDSTSTKGKQKVVGGDTLSRESSV